MPAHRGISQLLPLEPSKLDPTTQKLRQSWKFAALCQFLFVFDEAFGMSGFETELLEKDFEGTECDIIPDLMRRMLYTLTLDKRIDESNWQHHLRRQYLKRDPERPKLGTLQEPIGWDRLNLDDKVSALHDLCEWQLTHPERFRKLVKSEEDTTTWRVSPIGWDSKDNAYWLFDDNRIWIQRPEPIPEPATLSKSQSPAKEGSKRALAEAAAARRAAKAARAESASSSPAPTSRKRGRLSETTGASSKRTRTDDSPSNGSRPPPRRGTRSSARFAHDDQDGWEQVPAELLSKQQADGSDSELSEPPEDKAGNGVKVEDKDEPMDEVNQPVDEEIKEAEWVEFQAIVVTRAEWLEFAQRFAKSRDANEKNLHSYVSKELLPTVLAAFDEIEKQKALEAAMTNRKRSSRIAMKESEKEEKERDREARIRMEERMTRMRDEEDSKVRREEEEVRAHRAREDRIREREERLLAREREIEDKLIREEEERERREREGEESKRKRDEVIANGGTLPEEAATPEPGLAPEAPLPASEEENWELGCEVCGKAGINPPNEGKQIVACETCGVWQHVKCWNKFDKHTLGRKRNRDWDNEDFYCTKCRPPAEGVPRPTPGMMFKRERSSQDPEMGPFTPGGSPEQKVKVVHQSPGGPVSTATPIVGGTALPNAPAGTPQLAPPTDGPATAPLGRQHVSIASVTPGAPPAPSSMPPPSSNRPAQPQFPGAALNGKPSQSPSYHSPSMSRPSGSFPIRHRPGRSPLSKPYDSPVGLPTPPPLNAGLGLGPSRAISPSLSRGPMPDALAKGPAPMGAGNKQFGPATPKVPFGLPFSAEQAQQDATSL